MVHPNKYANIQLQMVHPNKYAKIQLQMVHPKKTNINKTNIENEFVSKCNTHF